ncbi:receptor-like protein EIX1 [Rutidosis leptorrhynchoides]|uniref:receptor-like protein EIX1 n=1 Tax=Rutidosis leptorrhynchoides TaxID=125765 RepID=UPI003A98D828
MKFQSSNSTGFFVLFIFVATKLLLSCGADNTSSSCFEHERQSLLRFKHSLISDPSNRLSSWNETINCCHWLGVGCDNTTGYVTRLDLRTNSEQLEGNELNSSLSELTRLSYLDLSGNYFHTSPIPDFIGSMRQLRYLNLSSAGFAGVVSHQIGNLSRLRVLDLSDRNSMMELVVDDFTWLTRLLSLEHLDLSGVNVTGDGAFDKLLLYMIPSLKELHLSNCGLSNSHFNITHFDSNITRSTIQTLDLSSNSFEGQFPLFLQNMTSLRVLDLSTNKLNSSIPLMNNVVELNLAGNRFSGIQDTGVWRQCLIKQLDLSFNYMKGGFTGPSTNVSECAKYDLETLILNDNKLNGFIPESLGNLTSLQDLVLSGNQLTGPIPTSIGKLAFLQRLDLSENLLNGTIPSSMGRLSKLQFLDLSSNLLQGSIPDSTGQLSKLQFLDISNNSLSGVITEAHFANMSMLIHLAATSNHMLSFKISLDWEPPFQLRNVLLGSCKFNSEFPPWIRTQTRLVILILSNTSISGPLPDWFRELPVIAILDLSHNYLTGPLTNLPSNPTTEYYSPSAFIERLADYALVSRLLLLKNNFFNGLIPDSLCDARDLVILDLSKNMLSGNVPDCFGSFDDLNVMILSSNRLSGVIPSSLGKLGRSIQWLHLNNNSFHGELPENLSNLTSLNVLDLGENRLSGSIPKWIGGKVKFLAVLRLHDNNFMGRIPQELCELSSDLQILDFGDNYLTGTIPHCFGNLRGMSGGGSNLYFSGGFEQSVIQVMRGVSLEYTTIMRYVVNMDLSSNNLEGQIPNELTSLSGLIGFNLSNNNLTGPIPDKIGDMNSLMSLDLSSNELSGTIPSSISWLTFLSHLNLSENKLSGRIPTGSQLQTLIDPSIYAGNSDLCGSPLTKRCDRDEVVVTRGNNDSGQEEEDDFEMIWIYATTSGFITGFMGILGVLVLKDKWRSAVFNFVLEFCISKQTTNLSAASNSF